MKIDTLKQLENVIKLCRKQGVTDIKIDGVELHVGPLPVKAMRSLSSYTNKSVEPTITQYVPIITEQDKILQEVSQIESDELTDEQKLFWSSEEAGV